ncbi:MAG: hypothetical protein K9J37_07090 [Saprospiraceae bacterium]|nr:hypothetical protein [Saprospiraceae bacterium]MCF8249661.1 hypothetical protein [Saprospiraceae bacterium]MCF8279819.1 hypothetical protein [Bacteroidales bacterium]MCF8312352.1 hypothetical protein [Saprospiraceae bacterium]MCF8440651.1 hypothetical protein [Saprospiraceae bacterium]
MMKKLIFPLAFAALFFACKNDSKDSSFQQVEANSPAIPADGSPADQLRAVAMEETNYLQRVRQSFVPLQEEYRNANGKVPGIGEVNIFVDDNYTLLIENKFKGSTYQTKVNLKNLNNAQGGMALVPDNAPGEFPGLKVYVKDGKPGVELSKDGKVVREERQLEIFLADRPGIERVTPAILQALNIANGNLPK